MLGGLPVGSATQSYDDAEACKLSDGQALQYNVSPEGCNPSSAQITGARPTGSYQTVAGFIFWARARYAGGACQSPQKG